MAVIIRQNFVIQNPDSRDFAADIYLPNGGKNLPCVLFCHGYKGFKDWGAWHQIALAFANSGFVFIKFNFSHNGTTLQNPLAFDDLEAFGENNYSKELSDLSVVISFAETLPEVNSNNIFLIGHSRGGGIALLKTFEDARVKALATWASVCNLDRFPRQELMEKWKQDGVFYIENGRTKQKMPHYFQYFEDYVSHRNRLNVQYAAQHLQQPLLIVHGSNDEAVNIREANLLHEWCKSSELKTIEGGTHTFNITHPWGSENLSAQMQTVCDNTIGFFKRHTYQ